MDRVKPTSDKNFLLTLVLAVCFGVFGAHRFYAGRIVTGILQFITFGGLGIWMMIDIVIIVFEEFTDSNGRKITFSSGY